MRRPFIPTRLLVLCLVLCAARLSAAGLPPGATPGDTFTLAAGHRAAGSSLIGQPAEKGGVSWTGVGKLVLTADGSVTVENTEAAMGLLALRAPEAAMDLSADLLPAGAGFVALALLPNDSPGDFWTTSAVWVLLHNNGDYEIYERGTAKLLKKGAGSDYAFKSGDFNHVEILCDPPAKMVSVKLNGTAVLPDTVLPELPPLVCAAFRFNENATPLAAKVDNFAVSPAPAHPRVTPRSSSQFYVPPDQPATLRWKCLPGAADAVKEVVVRDYSGRDVARLPVAPSATDGVEVGVKFPQGYYTLFFPQTSQEFGLVVMPAHAGPPDFFLPSTRPSRS